MTVQAESTVLRTAGQPRIAFRTYGHHGPRVLLVMGFGMRGALWEPQVKRLAHDHRLATFDHRGFGDSDPPEGPYRMRTLADDAVSVADALGWERFHLVGVSMGGMVAQELALAMPQRVASLTLIVTHSGGLRGLWPGPRASLLFARSGLGRDRVVALEQMLYPPQILERLRAEGLRERLQQQIGSPVKPAHTLLQFLALTRFDVRKRVSKIAAPTLVLKASRDILVKPHHSDELAARIPGAKLRTFAEAGHGILFQEAEGVSEAIREHIGAASD